MLKTLLRVARKKPALLSGWEKTAEPASERETPGTLSASSRPPAALLSQGLVESLDFLASIFRFLFFPFAIHQIPPDKRPRPTPQRKKPKPGDPAVDRSQGCAPPKERLSRLRSETGAGKVEHMDGAPEALRNRLGGRVPDQ